MAKTFFGCPRRARPRSASTPARERRFASQLADRSARDSSGSRPGARRPGAGKAFDTSRAVARDAHQRRGGAQRVCDVARRVRAPVRRHHRRRLAQHAVRRHPERRRLSRRSSIPRQRSSRSRTPPTPRRIWRGCSRMRSSSMASCGRMQAARGDGPGAAGVPDRQGAGADAPLGEERARRRHAGRVDRAADEEHPRQLGRARADDRGAGDRAGARSADRRARGAARPWRPTMPACGRGRTARSSTGGRSRRRRRRDDAGRGPRDGPKRAEAPARADGRDPEGDRLLAGHGRRANEGAGEGSPLPVRRGRQGPRGDHGVHPGSARLDPRADAARVQHAGQPEHGSEAAAAGRGARCAGRIRRRGLDRRQDSRPVLDQPPDHRACTASTASPT